MIRRIFPLTILLFLSIVASAQPAKIPDWAQQEKFLHACQEGDVDAVKKYLDAGGSVNVRDRFGLPPLIRVARGRSRNAVEIADLLLKAGADINAKDEFGTTAIFLTYNTSRIVSPLHKFLMEHGADASLRDKYGLTLEQRPAFYDKVKIDQNDVVWRLLLEGDLAEPPDDMSIMRPYMNGATIRMAAVYYGDSSNFPATFRWTPEFDSSGESYLFYAMDREHMSGFELLDIPPQILNAPNKMGITPLMRAAQLDNGEVIIKLLAAGAAPDLKDKRGRTALMHAVDYDRFFAAANLLIKADPNVTDASGRTPLMNAVLQQHKSALIAFITARASIAPLRERARRFPKERDEDLAKAANFGRIAINARDQKGRTALILAVIDGNAEIVSGLLDLGVAKTIKDNEGLTALDHATRQKNADIVKLLLKKR
ncbi:MAG: ankyrin repeat domain-containing protein [Acidobacteria bacterium]|nr:ankyrin repeat domain-containing protein [Acidobacteriota bacterium]